MKRLRALYALIPIAALALATVSGERHFTRNDSQAISAKAVPLNSEDLSQKTVGRLRYLGGWELTGDNSDFGGFSALSRLPDGRFLAISDSGWMAGFRLNETGAGAARIEDSFLARLPGAYGKNEAGEEREFRDRDSESITSDPGRRHYWIGYENRGAIRRFDADFARVAATVRPKAMEPWPSNGGAEAMVRLADGRFLIFSESQSVEGGGTEALTFSGDPTRSGVRVDRFAYLPPEGYSITDAAVLPDGRLLTLNRRIAFPQGFEAVVAIADGADVRPGALLRPQIVARLAPPLVSDNMEGLFVEQQQGRTIVWLISDDNHLVLQRSLLLKFELPSDGNEGQTDSGEPQPGFLSR